jgi:methylated-DNA-[protein]-cysteine S-methyltransferase
MIGTFQIGWQAQFRGAMCRQPRFSLCFIPGFVMAIKRLYLSSVEPDHAIGPILIVADGERLVALDFDSPEGRLRRILQPRYGRDILFEERACPRHIASAMHAYLNGDPDALDGIPADPGGTSFQQQVWTALRAIPPGTTMSYGELAARLDRPNAHRAVGSANALNPISIVIPLPPPCRQQRRLDRLWRRHRTKALAYRPRTSFTLAAATATGFRAGIRRYGSR